MIARMFSNATLVITWLGEHADDSDVTLDPVCVSFDSIHRSEQELVEIQSTAWCKLFSRTYWKRTWIIQETWSARDLVTCIGGTVMSRRYFAQRFREEEDWKWDEARRREFWDLHPGEHRLLQEDDGLSAEEGMFQYQYYMLLTELPYTYCSDRKDKIYSTLALGRELELQQRIKVKYMITVVELFIALMDVVASLIDKGDYAELFLRALRVEKVEAVEAISALEQRHQSCYSQILTRVRNC
jgi:hypothetical protein